VVAAGYSPQRSAGVDERLTAHDALPFRLDNAVDRLESAQELDLLGMAIGAAALAALYELLVLHKANVA
jgi:hypothetical protein